MSMIKAPLRFYPVLFLIGALLLFMPELGRQSTISDAISYITQHAASTLGFSFTISYVLCVICALIRFIKPKTGFISSIILTVLLFIYSFISVYVYKAFGIQNIASTLFLILQTNTGEASEFLKTYITDSHFICTTLIYLAIGGITIALYIFKTRYIQFLLWIRLNGPVVLLLAWAIAFATNKISSVIPSTIIPREHQVYQDIVSVLSAKVFKVNIDTNRMIYDNRLNATTNSSTNIVLIIGESFNRHHSSLYGYDLETCPQMFKHNPYVFKDVISPFNRTVECIKYLLSMEEANNDSSRDSQLLCPIMKNAGYNVIFYSNQIVKKNDTEWWDMPINLIFDNPIVEKESFNFRNSKKYEFDGELIDNFLKDTSLFENKKGQNFTIIHLMGSHISYSDRFPQHEVLFTVDSIKRNELTTPQKQIVANYDNSILYNDKQVSRILDYYDDKDAIIIYVSDHGDEANDFRIHTGRNCSFDGLPPASLHCQFDIPFIIFATDKYKEKHPEIIAEIEQSLDKPFMSDWLPYLILYLGEVNSGWNESNKCIISPKYDSSRKRILNCGINYDEVCSPTDKVIGF